MARAEWPQPDAPGEKPWQPGDVGQNPNADTDLESIRKLFGVPSQWENWIRNQPKPVAPSERKYPAPDPDDLDEFNLAGDVPTNKEDYDKYRAERVFSAANSDDLKYAFQVKRYERRPEWKQFMDDLGPQARMFDNKQLLQVFEAWNSDRMEAKPSWLQGDDAPSDTKALNDQFSPDDRNEAMGAAPEGKLMPRRGGAYSDG